MEQLTSAPYGSSPYSSMMEIPNRPTSKGPTSPGSHPQFFDGRSYFNAVAQEIIQIPVTRLAESSLDPWLMAGSASPGSSTLSTSPSHDITTPPSEQYYETPFPEQLPLPSYHFLEQPQPLRCGYTSHAVWKSSSEDWERNYAETELWNAQPFVAQPWIPIPTGGHVNPNVSNGLAYPDNGDHLPYTYVAQSHPAAPKLGQISPATGSDGSILSGSDSDDSSDDDSDWSEDLSKSDQSGASTSRSKSRTKSSRPHVERWPVPVNSIQQPETRGYKCNMPDCSIAFLRPEHLRRHYRSKHTMERNFKCQIPGCQTPGFSRGDNLRDHYWTHLDRGGRNGKNQKFSLAELKEYLGPHNKKLTRRLRAKHKLHMEKEIQKKRRVARPAFVVKSRL